MINRVQLISITTMEEADQTALQQALSKVRGVRSATVDVSAKTALVEGDGLSVDELVQAVKGVRPSSTVAVSEVVGQVGVAGMTCGGCVEIVTKKFSAIVGVQEATVDLDAKKATIRADSQFAGEQALAASLAGTSWSLSH